MFTVSSPSMAVNDNRAPVSYTMDSTITVGAADNMEQVVTSILSALNNSNADRIENLILCAHGTPGSFQIGTGLNILTMGPFERLQGKVTRIWFRGCLIARIIDSETPNQGDGAALQAYGITSGNGHVFIQQFARLIRCYVIAPTEMQGSRQTSYPRGVMDTYEGLVLRYDQEGNIVWQRRYPSLYGHNTQARNAMSPNQE